ncbi:hypothetical protein ACNI65_03540 [Roseateles sp. So40a]|uniref:hypothetical protein n=1 Tax=Roseateles sp. So40a TaxID=3400226 RepID=UPI003A83D831
MHWLAQALLQGAIFTTFLTIAIKHALFLLSRDGRHWLVPFLAATYADALWLGWAYQTPLHNALLSLLMPLIYFTLVVTLVMLRMRERKQRERSSS